MLLTPHTYANRNKDVTKQPDRREEERREMIRKWQEMWRNHTETKRIGKSNGRMKMKLSESGTTYRLCI